MLQVGDIVMTLDGHTEPIRWIGRRSYLGGCWRDSRICGLCKSRQARLAAGFCAATVGFVLPCYILDRMLVPAAALVNGATITKENHAERVDYVHIELARHDVILAEGAPSETFLTDDSRGLFHNASEYQCCIRKRRRGSDSASRR